VLWENVGSAFREIAGQDRKHGIVGNHVPSRDPLIVAHPIEGIANRLRRARPQFLNSSARKLAFVLCFASVEFESDVD